MNVILPNELIIRTLELAATIDTPTCLAVCLTSKNLSLEIGRRELYRNVKIFGKLRDGLAEERLRKWSSLCLTLLKNRNFARRVESLDVHLDFDLDGDSRATVSQFEKEDWNLLWNLLKEELTLTSVQREEILLLYEEGELGHYYRVRDRSIARFYGPAAYLGIAMIICPNLNVLTLDDVSYSAVEAINELNKILRMDPEANETSTGPSRTGFGSIRELVFRGKHNEVHTMMEVLFHWPGLKKVTIENMDYDDVDPSEHIHSSSVQELNYTTCIGYRTHIFAALLGCFQDLRILKIAWTEYCNVYRENDWRNLAKDLINGNPMLEELCLDIPHRSDVRDVCMRRFHIFRKQELSEMEDDDVDDLFYDKMIGLGSLKELRCLRKLSAPKFALFGDFKEDSYVSDHPWTLDEILPSSMEEVEVFCNGIEFTADDIELLDAPGTAQLRDITIFNVTRDRWISKRSGEGSTTLARPNAT